jgi:hypothetical protein
MPRGPPTRCDRAGHVLVVSTCPLGRRSGGSMYALAASERERRKRYASRERIKRARAALLRSYLLAALRAPGATPAAGGARVS